MIIRRLDLPFVAGLLAIGAYVSPWVIAGKNGQIRLHDNMDGMLGMYAALKAGGFWLASNSAMVGPVFDGGAPRVSYPGEISAFTPFLLLLDPYWAYVAYQAAIHVVAFVGMYALLDLVLQKDQPSRRQIIFGVGLCFAFLPFYAWAAGTATLPLAAFCLMRAWRGRFGVTEALALVVSALFASLPFTGFVVVGATVLVLLAALVVRRLSSKLAFAGALLIVAHLIVGWRLILFALLKPFESQRVDLVFGTMDAAGAVAEGLYVFFNGVTHAPSLHAAIILPFALAMTLYWPIRRVLSLWVRWPNRWGVALAVGAGTLVLAYVVYRLTRHPEWLTDPLQVFWLLGNGYSAQIPHLAKLAIVVGGLLLGLAAVFARFGLLRGMLQPSDWRKQPSDLWILGGLVAGLAMVTAIAVVSGIWNWEGLDFVRRALPFLSQFNITRLNFVYPFVWMAIFACALVLLARYVRIAGLVAVILGAQLALEMTEHEYVDAVRLYNLSYRQFFSPDLLDKIATTLPGSRDSYRVASIGLHPSITILDGFKTADGYFALYPQSYKQRFRNAVAAEFKRAPDLESYFDDWGSRAYFFSSEMLCPRNGSICSKSTPKHINRMDLNMEAMRQLKINYLFSFPTIGTYEELGLKYLGNFQDNNSPWNINIYKIPY